MKRLTLAAIRALRALVDLCAIAFTFLLALSFALQIVAVPSMERFAIRAAWPQWTKPDFVFLALGLVVWLLKSVIDGLLFRLGYIVRSESKRHVRPGLRPLDL